MGEQKTLRRFLEEQLEVDKEEDPDFVKDDSREEEFMLTGISGEPLLEEIDQHILDYYRRGGFKEIELKEDGGNGALYEKGTQTLWINRRYFGRSGQLLVSVRDLSHFY